MKIDFVKVRSKVLLAVALLVLLISTTSMAVVVRVDTVIGTFDINMREDVAPATVANFLNYVRDRDYDNMFFHRSIPNFIVQTGGFSFIGGEFLEVPEDPPVVNEFNLSNIRATVAMAKLGSNPNSATSQWFINLADNRGTPPNGLDFQNDGFTVFGEVAESDMAVADAIGDVDNAIPGVEIFIIEGDKTPPMSETPFAGVFTDLPALGFDPDLGIPIDPNGILFDPNSNLVLVNSIREVGADLLPSQTSLDFGLTNVGDAVQQSVTVTNKGLADLTLEIDATATGDVGFSVSGNTCTGPVGTDQTCAITFQFAPQGAGEFFASFGITSNDADMSDLTIEMMGQGLVVPVPRIALDPPDSLGLPAIEVGDSSSADITVRNIGTALLTIGSVTFGGEAPAVYSQTNDCGTLSQNTSCTITVTFVPVDGFPANADLIVTSNDPDRPTVALELVGDGVGALEPNIVLSGLALEFGEHAVNAISGLFLLVNNTGLGPLKFDSLVLGGENTEDWVIRNFCVDDLPVGQQCDINPVFRPRSEGLKSMTVTIRSNDPDQPEVIVTLTAAATDFADPVPVIAAGEGTSFEIGTAPVGGSLVKDLIVSNELGSAELIIESITIEGENASEFAQTNNCDKLAPFTGTCTITITVTPNSVGTKQADLVIVSNDPVRPTLIRNLFATAGLDEPDIRLAEGVEQGLAFGNVGINESESREVGLFNEGLQSLQVDSIVLSGTDAADFSVSDDCPDLVAPQSDCTLTITALSTVVGAKTATLTITSNDPDEGVITVPITANAIKDTDRDGVSDEVEDGHPNKNDNSRGDGDNDGIADALQSNVASLPNIFGQYVTIISPENTQLTNVAALEIPTAPGAPIGFGADLQFTQGFFLFFVEGVTEPITVTMIFPPGATFSAYFKVGRTADNPADHWFSFDFDGQLGAEIDGNRAILHLEDGQRGDSDLQANGIIVDPGAPVLVVPREFSSSTGSSGCTVATRTVPMQKAGAWWLIFGLIGWLGVLRSKIRGRSHAFQG